MAVILMIAIMSVIAMPLLHQQMSSREIDLIARRFIAHAQFARAQSLALGNTVHIRPSNGNLWEEGWIVSGDCDHPADGVSCTKRSWISQGDIAPIYLKGGGKQFIDPHTSKRGISFNAAGAAKSAKGGFVANRLILGHERDPKIERHLILGSGGRWRICDPSNDAKSCR